MNDVDDKSEASNTENPEAAAEGLDQVLPPVSDFSGFALSLAANAMMNLKDDTLDGRVASPASVNLKAAAEYIDILVMLEQKTKGNLSDAEAKLLESLLYDLRMQYVEVAGR
jgi:hypothetical protein